MDAALALFDDYAKTINDLKIDKAKRNAFLSKVDKCTVEHFVHAGKNQIAAACAMPYGTEGEKKNACAAMNNVLNFVTFLARYRKEGAGSFPDLDKTRDDALEKVRKMYYLPAVAKKRKNAEEVEVAAAAASKEKKIEWDKIEAKADEYIAVYKISVEDFRRQRNDTVKEIETEAAEKIARVLCEFFKKENLEEFWGETTLTPLLRDCFLMYTFDDNVVEAMLPWEIQRLFKNSFESWVHHIIHRCSSMECTLDEITPTALMVFLEQRMFQDGNLKTNCHGASESVTLQTYALNAFFDVIWHTKNAKTERLYGILLAYNPNFRPYREPDAFVKYCRNEMYKKMARQDFTVVSQTGGGSAGSVQTMAESLFARKKRRLEKRSTTAVEFVDRCLRARGINPASV